MKKYFLLTLYLLSISSITHAENFVQGNVQEMLDKSKLERICIDFKLLKSALDLYRLDHYKYPTTEEGLKMLVQTDKVTKEPLDPWSTPYQYKNNSMDISLSSLGADKKTGGNGLYADITLDSCIAE